MSPFLVGGACAVALGISALALLTRLGAAAVARRHPPTGRFVDVEGGRLHVAIREAEGERRGDVALIHGASGNLADMMAALGAPLARRGFRVIALDRPGHGWSARLGGRADASPARQALLIRRALAALGVEKATIVGHSLGAVAAASMAIDHAEVVDGLALLAPVTLPWPGGVAWYYDVASTPILGEIFTSTAALPAGWLMLERAAAGVFAPQSTPKDYAKATGVALVLRPANFRANAQDVTAVAPYVAAQGPRLAQIRTPTVIVTGDRDGVVYTHIHSDGAERLIPGARRVDLPGVGHSPHWAAPEAAADAIVSVATGR
jgi:pimeloyl-ACP methyl ester carboxylesterase